MPGYGACASRMRVRRQGHPPPLSCHHVNTDKGKGHKVRPSLIQSQHFSADDGLAAEAMAYARAVLMASARTVSGGDSYDAVDFLLRNMSTALICPSENGSSAIQIRVHDSSLGDGSRGVSLTSGEGEKEPEGAGDVGLTQLQGAAQAKRSGGNPSFLFFRKGSNMSQSRNRVSCGC